MSSIRYMQVSAGFDAHQLDPMEKLNYQSATYHALVSDLMSLADELCGEPLSAAIMHPKAMSHTTLASTLR